MSFIDSLKRGSAELVILYSLTEQDRHGYEIRRLLKERSGGAYQLAETSMYPIFYRLEKRGYISSYTVDAGIRRKRVMYHLEKAGKAYYEEALAAYASHTFGVFSIMRKTTAEMQAAAAKAPPEPDPPEGEEPETDG